MVECSKLKEARKSRRLSATCDPGLDPGLGTKWEWGGEAAIEDIFETLGKFSL